MQSCRRIVKTYKCHHFEDECCRRAATSLGGADLNCWWGFGDFGYLCVDYRKM